MSQVFRVAWYRFRATFSRRWGGYLTIMLLVGLLGGLAMVAVAGARRTQSAYPAYLSGSHASDLEVSVYLEDGNDPAQSYSPQLSNEISHLHDVAQAGTDLDLFLTPLNSKGLPANSTAIADGQVSTIGSLNGLFFNQDRPAVSQGRLPDPDRADEFMTTVTAARLLGWHVGEKFSMGSFTLAQISSSGFGTPKVRPARQFTATLVGTVVLNTQVVSDDIDRYPTVAIFTPALTRSLFDAGEAVYPSYQLRLLHGSQDVPEVEREIIDLLPADTLYNFHVTSVTVGEVERATKPESIAIAVFGAIAGLATLIIGGQAIGRRIASQREELGVLRALGGAPSMTISDSLIGSIGAVLIGVVLAIVVAILLSPLAPIGAVRQVAPSPGFAVGLAAGAVAALGLTLAASIRRRRRDLALLKTLDFTRRQLLAAVGWQASVAATVGVVVGVPLGIVSGRWLWTLFAREIFAVPYPSVPVGQIIVVVVGALVLASLVAIPPGLSAARTRTSLLLRAE